MKSKSYYKPKAGVNGSVRRVMAELGRRGKRADKQKAALAKWAKWRAERKAKAV